MTEPGAGPEPRSGASELLHRAATSAASRTSFMASPLARFRQLEGLDATGLARWLGVDPTQLDHLALCGLPRPDRFRADVEAIAGRFGVEPARLANLLREVSAVTALEAVPSSSAGTGTLAAARDHENGEDAADEATPPDEDR